MHLMHLNLSTVADIIMDVCAQQSPFLVGITGSSGAGKTTLSLALQDILQQMQPEKKITVIQADNFIYSNAWLQLHDLMSRKGFPESFNASYLQQCLEAIKQVQLPFAMPCYSQDIKDIMPDEAIIIQRSDIYIIEGVNLFFSYENNSSHSTFRASDKMNFCIYLDTARDVIKERALNRFFDAYKKSQIQPMPAAYFEQFSGWSEAEIFCHAEQLWEKMDMNLLDNYIEPNKTMAHLLLEGY